jgi:DNA-binding GntR family transcriptional regulator
VNLPKARLADTSSVQRLSDEVTGILRNAIIDGSLESGARLVERDLAAHLGVSRVPIREAIQRLAEIGLVKKVPHRGTFVQKPSRKEIEEITSLRILLEGFVMERVIDRWQPHYGPQLRTIVDQMRDAEVAEDRYRVFELDRHFHELLWQFADHEIVFEVSSSLRSRIGRFLLMATTALETANLDVHGARHGDLVAYLEAGDVTGAKEAMTRHIYVARDRILRYFEADLTTSLP